MLTKNKRSIGGIPAPPYYRFKRRNLYWVSMNVYRLIDGD
jgi:hypothetical protein